jgi:glycosyltransferase involved in cell wall biosynthesis
VRVLHVGLETTEVRPGGLNRYLEALLVAERDAGLEAEAVVLGPPEPSGRGLRVAGPVGRSMARAALDVDREARRGDAPDVADLHFAGTASVTATLGALRSVPKVVHFQGPWADESAHAGATRLNVAIKRFVERRVYRRASRFVVLTPSFAELLERRYGVAPWAVDVVAPGVDLERFSPGDRAASRAAVGAPGGRVVLAVRRLVPRMGLEVLLEAWAQLSPGSDDALVVVGDGPSAPELRRVARTLGVEATVRLLGRVDDESLVAWYRAADVTVVPSVALEGFGLVVLESLACGTPVVGTDAGGLADALAVAGGLPAVPAGDAAALADAVRTALASPRDPASDRARRETAAALSWANVAERHREVYAAALDEDRPLRVAVLDHTAVLSGAELALARALSGLDGGVDAHVVLGEEGPLRARLQASGATVEVLALDPRVRTTRRADVRALGLGVRRALATARDVVRLARRLRQLRPDVVHANTLKAALYGGVAARLAGVPCVWHVRDRLEPPALPAPAARLARAAAHVLPTVVVANSQATLATVGVEGHVVPSPLDPAVHAPAPGSREPGPLRLTVLGRLAPWKGQHLAIEAFAAAFPHGDEQLVVVGAPMFGDDDYADTLAPLAERLGVADRVTFLGFVDDVATVLARTDVLVHASIDPEPFGQVVLEALGAGCAVVVPDEGGPAEVVTDGLDGLWYRRGDRTALAATLRRLADDPATRERLAAHGVVTAQAYTPSAIAPRLVAAWQEARGKGRRR